MNSIPDWVNDNLPQLLTAIAMVLVGFMTGRANILAKKSERETKRVEGATPSYQALDARVAKLENQVGDLRREVERLEDTKNDLHALATAQNRFITTHVPSDVPRPFDLPPWFERELSTMADQN